MKLAFCSLPIVLSAHLLLGNGQAAPRQDGPVRRLPVTEFRDKMKGAWIGQMIGVGWGMPTEFKIKGEIIPEDKMPAWTPDMVNQHNNDDCYVEMTFLRTLEQYGFDASIRQAGIDFANSGYRLWHANKAGRDNLRAGIAPPDSGHPKFNEHADDIDYQIEADFSGIIAPGLPNTVIALGEKFGRLMNFGDGLYGGQFVGGMYAEAYFESDPWKLVEAGLKCVPPESQYAEMIRDLLKWCRENSDWTKTWQLVEEKYHKDPRYSHNLCGKPGGKSEGSIDAKLNGAYIIIGLLYGAGDPDKTIIISCRCGQDSDCNPANAAGVLFAAMGASKIPTRFTERLDLERKFSFTEYALPAVYEVCEKLARQAIDRAGGRIEKGARGEEIFVIPVQPPKPSALEQSWEPRPSGNARFTPGELEKINPANAAASMHAAVEKFAPGWEISNCGTAMNPGLRAEWGGKQNVLVTHPLDRQTGCVLKYGLKLPEEKKSFLRVVIGHDPRGDFDLIVRANGQQLLRKSVSKATATAEPWLTEEVDLSSFAGKKLRLELVNEPTGWRFEGAYWAEIAIVSQ